MSTCPSCRYYFRVLEDEDDGQHGCPSCGYTGHADDDDTLEDLDDDESYNEEDLDEDQ
jgi:hypothetical protein